MRVHDGMHARLFMPALRTWILAQVGGNGLRGRGPRHRFRRGRRHAALRRQPVLRRNGQGAFRRNGQGGRRYHQIISGRCAWAKRRVAAGAADFCAAATGRLLLQAAAPPFWVAGPGLEQSLRFVPGRRVLLLRLDGRCFSRMFRLSSIGGLSGSLLSPAPGSPLRLTFQLRHKCVHLSIQPVQRH